MIPKRVFTAARKDKNTILPKMIIAAGIVLPLILMSLTPTVIPLFLPEGTQLLAYFALGIILALLGVYLNSFFAIALVSNSERRELAFQIIGTLSAIAVTALILSFLISLTYIATAVIVGLWFVNDLVNKYRNLG